jgi:phage tail P2-like protein
VTNTVYDVDFTRALPDPLKNDPNMLALGRVIAAELGENIRLARHAIIYARIDELPEDILDILAHDLHVDWYDDSFPIAAKRAIIKDSVKVHKRMGTKYAILTALRGIFPNTDVQEWFEYGGEPYRFRINLDMNGALVHANYAQIMWAVNLYKRLTAHLDGISSKTELPVAYIDIHNRPRRVASYYRVKMDLTLHYNRNLDGHIGIIPAHGVYRRTIIN